MWGATGRKHALVWEHTERQGVHIHSMKEKKQKKHSCGVVGIRPTAGTSECMSMWRVVWCQVCTNCLYSSSITSNSAVMCSCRVYRGSVRAYGPLINAKFGKNSSTLFKLWDNGYASVSCAGIISIISGVIRLSNPQVDVSLRAESGLIIVPVTSYFFSRRSRIAT